MKVHKNNPRWMAIGIATILLCTLLFSCNNEDLLESGNPEKACDNICFSLSSDKNVQTRGDAGRDSEGHTVGHFVLRSDNSADTLCVRTLVSDGINVSGFEGKQALTRATPVSKDYFYEKFHVLAYWSKKGTLVNQFFMNTNVSNIATSVGTDAAIWSTDQKYYWPGADHSFQFYAWAPTNAGGLTTPSTPQEKSLAYIVPEAAADQKDIVVATTDEIWGNKNAAVPLTFRHICTAVRFVVGSLMQPGSIKSVALKGVRNVGTYDMATGTWSLRDATVDFSQTLNKETTGTEANGNAITDPESTFMMLPQTLLAGATIEVVFVNANNVERTLTASIGNTLWAMGTTVTYKLSITPEYELEFSEDNPTVADAHYAIIPIKINAKELNKGNYTLKVSDPTVCKLRESLVGPEEQGYWPKEDTGGGDFVRMESVSSNVEGETVYYAFLTENATEANREVEFELQYNGKTIRTMTILQKCPNWIGDMGWEHFEEDEKKPFGFAWTRKVVYKQNNSFAGILIRLYSWFGVIESNPAVTISGSALLNTLTCTIDYSKAEALSNVYSETDGLTNTKNFSANSASTLTSIENTLRDLCEITSETGENINSTDFAALVCFKKNPCNVERQSSNGQVAYIPAFDDADIKWYLPASGQFTTDAGLIDRYWSSTAINDNANAYSWNNSAKETPRMDLYKVRAARVKE